MKRFLPSEFGVVHSTAKAEVPEIVGARISIYKEIQAAHIPHTLIHCNGFMEDWFSGTCYFQEDTVRLLFPLLARSGRGLHGHMHAANLQAPVM